MQFDRGDLLSSPFKAWVKNIKKKLHDQWFYCKYRISINSAFTVSAIWSYLILLSHFQNHVGEKSEFFLMTVPQAKTFLPALQHPNVNKYAPEWKGCLIFMKNKLFIFRELEEERERALEIKLNESFIGWAQKSRQMDWNHRVDGRKKCLSF